MKSLRLFAPNFITSLNLLSGALAVVFVFEGNVLAPVYLLLAASVFDFLDGFVAKALNATSEFGKQMDSLADLISFGFAPSALIYKSIFSVGGFVGIEKDWETFIFTDALLLIAPFVFLVFAALRLARFNILKSVGTDFTGMPVPAATLFVVSFWLVLHSAGAPELHQAFSSIYVIVGLDLFLSFLMVSKIPMLSLKFQGAGIKLNFCRYTLILGAVMLFVAFHIQGLLFVMIYYLFLSLIKVLIALNRKQ